MKKQFIKFINQPKKVVILSLVIAGVIGFFGYRSINKTVDYRLDLASEQTTTDNVITGPQSISLGFLAGGRIKFVSVKAGDKVHKGDILAKLDAENVLGSLTQAKAQYASAKANYQKVINGATGTAVEVAKVSLHNAGVGLEQVTKQQNTLVSNAKRNLLNSNVIAEKANETSGNSSLIITGSYNKDAEGVITISPYQTGDGVYFNIGGLVTGIGKVSTIPQALGDSGLSVAFPSNLSVNEGTWSISIPNTKAANYLTNYNAYQSAIQSKNQAIAQAQAQVDQAEAGLALVVASARPEDVATSQALVDNAYGALEIAQAAYNNTIITAPSDGIIHAVSIANGQIAVPNAPAIEILADQL